MSIIQAAGGRGCSAGLHARSLSNVNKKKEGLRPDCNRALTKENRKLRLLLLIREIEAGAREKITQAQMAEELGVTERYARELIRSLRTEGEIRTWNSGPLRDEKGRFVKVGRANEEPHFIGTPLQYFFPEQLCVQDEMDAVEGKLSHRPLGTENPNQRHVESSSVPNGGTVLDSDLEPESVEKAEFSSGVLTTNKYLIPLREPEPEVVFDEVVRTAMGAVSPDPHIRMVSGGEGEPPGSQPHGSNGTAESGSREVPAARTDDPHGQIEVAKQRPKASTPSHPLLDLIPILSMEIEEMTEELLN